jgi:hypothetical protein
MVQPVWPRTVSTGTTSCCNKANWARAKTGVELSPAEELLLVVVVVMADVVVELCELVVNAVEEEEDEEEDEPVAEIEPEVVEVLVLLCIWNSIVSDIRLLRTVPSAPVIVGEVRAMVTSQMFPWPSATPLRALPMALQTDVVT